MEVYHFLECEIKRVGSAAGDSTETSIDAFAEGVSVSVSRELQPRIDTSGVVQQRVPIATEASMSIQRLFTSEATLFDGNAIKLIMGNIIGTTSYQLSGAYWTNKDFSGGPDDDGITHDLQIVGQDFGTVS